MPCFNSTLCEGKRRCYMEVIGIAKDDADALMFDVAKLGAKTSLDCLEGCLRQDVRRRRRK